MEKSHIVIIIITDIAWIILVEILSIIIFQTTLILLHLKLLRKRLILILSFRLKLNKSRGQLRLVIFIDVIFDIIINLSFFILRKTWITDRVYRRKALLRGITSRIQIIEVIIHGKYIFKGLCLNRLRVIWRIDTLLLLIWRWLLVDWENLRIIVLLLIRITLLVELIWRVEIWTRGGLCNWFLVVI